MRHWATSLLQKNKPNQIIKESGNVFLMLFGAVALVGVLGASTMTILRGPVQTMSQVTKRTVAENNMMATAKITVVTVANDSINGDCDGDGTPEAYPWGTAIAGTGGGTIPSNIGVQRQDPWGNEYVYCTWDHGTDNDQSCGTGTNYAQGEGVVAPSEYAVFLFSAGPDGVYETTCNDYTGPGSTVTRTPGADDVVFGYTFDEAAVIAGGLWTDDGFGNAEIGRDLFVRDGGVDTFVFDNDAAAPILTVGDGTTGTGQFPTVRTDNLQSYGGAGGTINVDSILNSNSNIVTNQDVLATNLDASTDLNVGGDGFITNDLTVGGNLNITDLNVPGNTTLGTNAANTIELNGTVTTDVLMNSGNLTLGSGNADIGGNFEVTGSTDLFGSLDVAGATDLDGILDVFGRATFGSTVQLGSDSCTVEGQIQYTNANNVEYCDGTNWSRITGFVEELGDIGDVDLTSGLSNNDVIRWNGTDWIPGSVSSFFVEQDPQVNNTLTQDALCIAGASDVISCNLIGGGANEVVTWDGSDWVSNTIAGIYTETDPQVDTIGAAGLFCTSDGSAIDCTTSNPTGPGAVAGRLNDFDNDTFVDVEVGATDDDEIRFGTAGTEIMRITNTGEIGIGTTTPDASAMITMDSTTQGLLPPRMQTVDKTAIVNPATGLIVYDSDLGYYEYNAGTPGVPDWQPITPAGVSSFWTDNTTHITRENVHIINSGQTSTTAALDGDGRRFFFDPDSGAFRGGEIAGGSTYWQDANIGDNSFAFGNNARATGNNSFAVGREARANGLTSFAFGENQRAESTYSIAIGSGSFVDAQGAMGFGRDVRVTANYSAAFGLGDAAGPTNPEVSGTETIAFFFGDQTGEDITATNVLALEGGSLLLSNDSGTACAANKMGALRLDAAATGLEICDGAGTWGPLIAGSANPDRIQDTDNNTSIDVDTSNDGLSDDIVFENNGAENMRLTSAGNMGLGTPTPDASAIIDITSTTGGILGPRMTTIDKNAIVNPATGLYVFDTDLNRYQYNSGTPGAPIWSDFTIVAPSIWTDNTTHITRETFNIIDTGQTSTTAGLDGDGRRAFYDPDTGAFRGGEITGGDTAWQAVNIGNNSFAWGENSEASGSNSIATGVGATASNSGSIAIGGDRPSSSGISSVSIGRLTNASGDQSIAMGNNTTASASRSVAIGSSVIANNDNAIALGNQVSAQGARSAAIGLGITAGTTPILSGTESMAIFFGDQTGENITATNVLALEGGSLLLSNDSGTACDAAKQGALRLNAGGSGLEMCDGAGTWAAYPAAVGIGDRIQDTDNNTFIDVDTTDDGLTDEITITNNGTESIRIDAAGNVGIGTPSPSGTIHLLDDSAASIILDSNNASNSAFIQFQNVTGTSTAQIRTDNSPDGLSFRTGGSGAINSSMIITPDGRVGIGRGSPDVLPDVSAILDTTSTTLGILGPRMTTIDKNAIVTPATGLYVFDTDLNRYQYNSGTPGAPVWTDMAPAGVNFWTDNITHLTRENVHIIDSGQTSTTAGLDGDGQRFFFDPDSGAFRGGEILGGNNAWQAANIGTNSFSWGSNAEAGGVNSIALGSGTTASGPVSTAFGNATSSTGFNSTSFGVGTTASGNVSTAFGNFTSASGFSATSLGNDVRVGTGTGQVSDANVGEGNYSVAFGLGDASTVTLPQVTGNETFAIFFGDQQGEDITATNVLALEGGSLLLSNDSGTACAANKQGALRLNATGDGLEICDFAGPPNDWTAFPGNNINDRIQDTDNDTFIDVDTTDDGLTDVIVFNNNAAETMRITPTGDVVIGDTAASLTLMLDVAGQVGATEYCDQNGINCTAAADLTRLWTDNTSHITRENFHIIDTGSDSTTAGLDVDGIYSFYDTDKAAFRGGTISGGNDAWQDANIGNYSFTWGENNEAANFAAAFGRNNNATGVSSFAAGESAEATGDYSTSLGLSTQATGDLSKVIGNGSIASGFSAISIGYNADVGTGTPQTDALSANEGNYSMTFGLGNPAGVNPSTIANETVAFFFGDQSGETMTATNVLALEGGSLLLSNDSGTACDAPKQGALRLGATGTTLEMCDGAGAWNVYPPAGGIGDRIQDADNNTFIDVDTTDDGLTDTIVFNNNAAETMRITPTGDVIIGDTAASLTLMLDVAGQIGATEYCDQNGINCTAAADLTRLWTDNTSHITRENFHIIDTGSDSTTAGLDVDGIYSFYDTDKAAFRGGSISGGNDAWQDANIGNYSFAWGENNEAANFAAAFGRNNNATGISSFAAGESAEATGDYSTSLGLSTQATGDLSKVIGNGSIASGFSAISIGYNADVGTGTPQTDALSANEGNYSMTFGLGNPAGVNPSTIANETVAFFFGDQSGETMTASNVLALEGGSLLLSNDSGTACDAPKQGALRLGATGTTLEMCDGAGAWNVYPPAGGIGDRIQDADNNTFIDVDTTDDGLTDTIVFNNNGAEAMRIGATGNVGIGTTADASALLDIASTTAGMLTPRMTIADRDLIAAPATGLLVFTTDAGTSGLFQFWDGAAWVDVGGGGAASGLWTDNTTHITRENFHVLDAGLAAGSTTAGIDGDGTYSFYDPDKGAFRGGTIFGGNDAWQDANIGNNSFAWGDSTEASNANSTAFGSGSTASGINSLSVGNQSIASGTSSFAFGNVTTASGESSYSFGRETIATGDYSVSFGLGNPAGPGPQVTGNETFAIFFGNQIAEDITATNVLALEGGSLLLSNDSGTACAADKQGALRLDAAATGLEMCDGAGTWNPLTAAAAPTDRIQDTDNNTFIDVDTTDDGLTDVIVFNNNGTEAMRLDASGALLIGATVPILDERVMLSKIYTATAGNSLGQVSIGSVAPTGASTANMISSYNQIDVLNTNTFDIDTIQAQYNLTTTDGSGDITNAFSASGATIHSGTGSLTNLNSFYASVQMDNTGTVTDAAPLYGITEFTNGTATNSYGLYLDSDITGATVTNRYGVYLAPPLGTATNEWGFYQTGAALTNFFEGGLLLTNASSACAAGQQGAIRLNAAGTGLEMCDGAGAWNAYPPAGGISDRIQDTDNNTFIDVDTTDDGLTDTVTFQTNGTERIRLENNGVINIGTSKINGSSTSVLGIGVNTTGSTSITTLNGAAAPAGFEIINQSTSIGTGAGLSLTSGVVRRARIGSELEADGVSGSFKIETYDGATISEKLRVTGDGLVGIGTSTPNDSAILDISSTTAGMLTPRMTIADRDLIAAPATGLLVFTTDAGASGLFQFWDGAAWVDVGGGGAAASGLWTDNTTHITRGNYHIINSGQDSTTAGLDGDGRRAFYDPDTGAFRGGEITGGDTAWQAANIGNGSFAWGQNSEASGAQSTVSGGNDNIASGAFQSTVGGGFENTASGALQSTVGGGRSNTASGDRSTVSGGDSNVASGSRSTVSGGDSNVASGNRSTISGGDGNTASGYAAIAFGHGVQVGTGAAQNTDASASEGNYSVGWGLGDAAGAIPQITANETMAIFFGDQTGENITATNVLALEGGSLLLSNDSGTACAADKQGALRLNATANGLEMCDGAGAWNAFGGGGANVIDDLGDAATDYVTDFNLFMGQGAGASIIAGGQNNLFIGQDAGNAATDGDEMLAIGRNALAANTKRGAMAIGYNAAPVLAGGNDFQPFMAIGQNVALSVTSAGDGIVIVGNNSASTTTTIGNGATIIGHNTLEDATGSLDGLTVLGASAGEHLENSNNSVILGRSAAEGDNVLTTDIVQESVIIGNTAIQSIDNLVGSSVIIGAQSATNMTEGLNNTIIGRGTAATLTDGDDNIIIGSNIDVPAAATSDYLNIGNTIYGDLSNDAVGIGSSVTASGDNSFAVGALTTATGDNSIAIGQFIDVSGYNGMAFGYEADVGTGTAQTSDANADEGNYSVAFGLGDAVGTSPTVTGNESFAIFFGDQNGEDITATNVLALEGGSLLLSNDSGTACDAAKAGALRLNATADGLEMCDGAGTWVAFGGGGSLWTAGAGDDIYYNTGTPEVGIGTTTPTSTFEVVGNSGDNQYAMTLQNAGADGELLRIRNFNNNNILTFNQNNSGNPTLEIRNDDGSTLLELENSGELGVNKINPNEALDVEGNIQASNNVMIGNFAQFSGVAGNAPAYDIPALALNDLTDTSVAAPSNNDVLTWNGTNWVSLPSSGGANEINDLTDGYTDYTTDFNLFMGQGAGASIVATSQNNTAIGINAMTAYADTDNGNTAIGYNAAAARTDGIFTAIGNNALNGASGSGLRVVAIGQSALESGSGDSNVAIGFNSMQNSSTGSNNVGIGRSSLRNNTGANNTAIGHSVMEENDGQHNVAIGMNAGHNPATSTFDNNILIGYQTGDTLTTGSNNIIIGYDIDASAATASNELNIGDTLFGNLTNNQVGVGVADASAIDVSAILDINSTTLGILGPRMSTADKNAIVTPATGLYVFDTDLGRYQYNSGTPGAPVWADFGTGGGTPGGLDTQVQFNNGGVFDGDAEFTWDTTNQILDIDGAIEAEERVTLGITTGAAAPTYPLAGGSSFWTDNTTHITRENYHILDAGLAAGSTTAGLDGDGTYSFYDPDKGALRVGTINSGNDAWQDANIGTDSFAAGVNNQASGASSAAFGGFNNATGNSSFSTGFFNNASGEGAVAMGSSSNASGLYAQAFGNSARSAGDETVALGHNNYAWGYRSMVIGSSAHTGLFSDPQTSAVTAGRGNYSLAIGLGDSGGTTANHPRISGNESMAIFFGAQTSEDITATNVLALEGGSLLLSNDSGTACAANKQGALRLNATADGLEMCDGAGTWAAFGGGGGLWTAGAGDDIYYNTGTPQVGIGLTDPTESLHITASEADIIIESTSTTAANGSDINIDRSRAGAVVQNDDKIGSLRFRGHGGVTLDNAAQIAAISDGTPGDGDMPTRLEFHVADEGEVVSLANTPEMVIKPDGNIGIGTATPAEALDVVGNIQYTGILIDASDRRLKENIEPLSSDDILSRISEIDTYSFTMKGDEDAQLEFGVMAQELEKIFPELVTVADDEMKTRHVNYVGFIAPLIEATKELKAENEELRTELAELKDNQEKILKDMAEIKSMIGAKSPQGAQFNPLMLLLMGLLGGGLMMVITRRRQQE